MNVDLLKSAFSDDVRKDVVRALEGDRMVTLNGKSLLIEQEGGETSVYLLRRYTIDPGDLFICRFEKA